MSRDIQTLPEYLDHVLTAIRRISRYTQGTDEAAFLEDELIQDAVLRNLENVGEACNNIRRHFPDFAAKHRDVPFSAAYEMRNAIAHGYHKVDMSVIWATVAEDLPAMERQFEALAAEVKHLGE